MYYVADIYGLMDTKTKSTKMMRRTFLKTGTLGIGGGMVIRKGMTAPASDSKIAIAPNFTSDGLGLSPRSYVSLLSRLVEEKEFTADVYCLGDVIHDFEKKIAKSLGKEKAIYMPTGTLANHIALRLHCTRRKKAIVQQQSHIYRDSGDAIPHLSGIHMLPLALDNVFFSVEDVLKTMAETDVEKVHTGIEAISIETPVRRKHLRRFGFNEMQKISTLASKNGIGMHLDGARIYGESVLSGIPVKKYGELFDTVYVSLYKYFNSTAGAILAGPAVLIDGLHNERRMFGGSLRSAWENILVADYFFDDFESRFLEGNKIGKVFLNKLADSGKFRFHEFEDGTNVFQLFLQKGNPEKLRKRVLENGIDFPAFNKTENCFIIKLNESLNEVDVNKMVEIFTRE